MLGYCSLFYSFMNGNVVGFGILESISTDHFTNITSFSSKISFEEVNSKTRPNFLTLEITRLSAYKCFLYCSSFKIS